MNKMKEKIEITQADLLSLLVKKIEFLTEEYKNLHGAYNYEGKGKTKVDPIKIATSYEKFLKEEGDIDRLLELFDLFGGEGRNKKTTAK
jgi:hypothetical protein